MTTGSINPSATLVGFVGKASQAVKFPAGDQDGFRIGELIRARVLRQVSENRYAMQFKDGERQVDSAIPFRTGDILYGRVVGIGSQVEIERIRLERGEAEPAGSKISEASARELDQQSALAFTQRLQRPLTAAETQIIGAFKGGAERTYLATLAGLALRNLGVGVSAPGIENILSAMNTKAGRGVFPIALEESVSGEGNETHDSSFDVQTQVLQLAPIIKRLVEDIPEARHRPPDEAVADIGVGQRHPEFGQIASNSNDGEREGNGEQDSMLALARWILNLESGSSVKHRINTIPLLVNGQLIELDVALFAEHGNEDASNANTGNNPYGSIVLSLTTPTLGRLELRITSHGRNITFVLTAERENVIEAFASHASILKAELEQTDWKVGEMTYRQDDGKSEGAGHAVLWHLANLDRYQIYV